MKCFIYLSDYYRRGNPPIRANIITSNVPILEATTSILHVSLVKCLTPYQMLLVLIIIIIADTCSFPRIAVVLALRTLGPMKTTKLKNPCRGPMEATKICTLSDTDFVTIEEMMKT